MKRKNLHYMSRTRVVSVLFDGDRAVGVRARSKGAVTDYTAYTATKEVIIAAGAVETPLLLERSGIGDPEVLHAAGVPLRVESPNVGNRVLEQRMVLYQAKINQPLGGYNQHFSSTLRQTLRGAAYLATRSGFIATGAYDISAFFKSTPHAPHADLFGIFNPIALDLTPLSMRVGTEPARHPPRRLVAFPRHDAPTLPYPNVRAPSRAALLPTIQTEEWVSASGRSAVCPALSSASCSTGDLLEHGLDVVGEGGHVLVDGRGSSCDGCSFKELIAVHVHVRRRSGVWRGRNSRRARTA